MELEIRGVFMDDIVCPVASVEEAKTKIVELFKKKHGHTVELDYATSYYCLAEKEGDCVCKLLWK